ncbi:hypothetical protein [Roseateles sp. LYH14W]|uniref:Anti-sigma factor n=1 Tax=Pelomonas parva TaxID=3299032 RepID=A0ABW7F8I8_9BURK
MLTGSQDERWLAVLAGQAAPADAAERQAAELRGYFEQRVAAVPAADAEQEKRLMNMLRARGAFADAVPARPTGLLAALSAWWNAPQGRMGYGYGAAALLAFVVVSTPLLQQPQDEGGGDEVVEPPPHTPAPPPRPGQPKSLPKTLQGGAVVVAAEPEQAALRLQLALSAQGVSSALQRDGAGWRLTAELPAAARAALEPELQVRSLAWPGDGRLDVRFVKPQ